MAGRDHLCRPGRAVSVPPRSRLQPGRLFLRDPARQRAARRARGLVRLHHAVGPDHVRLCRGRCRPYRAGRRGCLARAQARRGRGRRPGDLGHGADARARSGARRHRLCSRGDRGVFRRIVCADRGDRGRCRRRPLALPGRRRAGVRSAEFSGHEARRRHRAGSVHRTSVDASGRGDGDRLAGARAVRRVLPVGRACLWRRPCRAAAAAGAGGHAGMGQQRGVSRRLRTGAGGTGTALHLRRLSRRRDGPAAERPFEGPRSRWSR